MKNNDSFLQENYHIMKSGAKSLYFKARIRDADAKGRISNASQDLHYRR